MAKIKNINSLFHIEGKSDNILRYEKEDVVVYLDDRGKFHISFYECFVSLSLLEAESANGRYSLYERGL